MRARRQRRSTLLHRIYEVADASVTEFVSAYELAAEQDVAQEEARKAIAYLEEKGYLLVDDHRAGVVRITAEGIDAVELGRLEN
jgi:Mn-dependent DtxR family transcriptional regulator